jgi:hypothetical protein
VKYTKKACSAIAIVSAVAILFSACRKINDATELGSGLIPPIDNINTFETFLDIESDNKLYNDTNKVYYTDLHALGYLSNDPEFGTTKGDSYFNVSYSNLLVHPFYNKDSVVAIDSVVLSLAYDSYYGDTNSTQTVRVFEVAQSSGLNDTTLFKYNQPDLLTTGGELGSKSFQIKNLDDTILHIRKRDTTKLANVLRIPLTTQLGTRFKNYDTTNTANGAYRSDSIFKTVFRGLAIKADNTGSALAYFIPSDNAKTKLTIYFQVRKNGVIDTTSVDFMHTTGGQANIINRTPAGGWNSYLANAGANDDLLYLQTTPGSYGLLRIPALDTFRNSVIHRAEIIATPIRTAQDNIFTQQQALFLDRVSATGDSVLSFDNDMGLSNNISNYTYDINSFGGLRKSDSTFRFNISRYVQNMVTKRTTNYKLRIYTPVRTFIYSPAFGEINQIYVTDQPASGRVVIAGGSYVNPAKRLRLRLVYSKL